MLNDLQETIQADPSPSMIESFSCLVQAFNGSVETLAKLQMLDTKIKGQKEIKQMDIDAKGSEQLLLGNGAQQNTPGIFASREEIIKGMAMVLLENGKDKPEETRVAPPIDV